MLGTAGVPTFAFGSSGKNSVRSTGGISRGYVELALLLLCRGQSLTRMLLVICVWKLSSQSVRPGHCNLSTVA